MGVDHK